ncbi:response regulator transcription factor [Zhihengliuella flava]|uniref:Two-component system response regulator DesR n=1 Tax=Zhihengliuella flava TaxID=1285193 RepID=A0A931D869_9MICC|nr:response regulator transcription factor [Zhihengliuella flava]MBG6084174.1 two-component system response regulator DesR [Zhihengliuella flava]
MIRILLADDEDLIRGALVALLNLEDDLEVVASTGDGASALDLAITHRPDVCVLDLEMPPTDGVVVAEQLRRHVKAKSLIVTRHARPGVLRRALGAGVDGFAPKSMPAEELARVIRDVAAGKRYVDPEIAASALSGQKCPLSERELDVLRVGRDGARISAIAAQLHLAEGTVRNYVSAILAKLDVATRQEAAHLAWEQGWI